MFISALVRHEYKCDCFTQLGHISEIREIQASNKIQLRLKVQDDSQTMGQLFSRYPVANIHEITAKQRTQNALIANKDAVIETSAVSKKAHLKPEIR